MQHPDDLGPMREGFVEDDVIPDCEAADAHAKFRTLSSGSGIFGKHLEDTADSIEQTVRCGDVIRCDEEPDFLKINFSLRTPGEITRHARLSAVGVLAP